MEIVDWNELIIKTTQEAKEAVANLLNEYGANGVVIEEGIEPDSRYGFRFGEMYELKGEKYTQDGVILKAYFLQDDKWPSLKEKITEKIEQLPSFGIDIGEVTYTVQTVQEADWENEWKKYFKPFHVTDRFMIVPTWEKEQVEGTNSTKILMDPGMAFGTGTHPTTKLSLLALEKSIQQADIVIDVGSGSGILSIASALLGAKHVYSYDLDQVAVQSTIQNRDLNNLTDSITVQANDLLKGISHEPKADIIVANILAHIILQLIDDAYEQLKVGGLFIVSGIIEKEAKTIQEALTAKDFHIIEQLEEEHWHTFITKKVADK